MSAGTATQLPLGNLARAPRRRAGDSRAELDHGAAGTGTRAGAGGHEVEIVDRDPAEAQKLASEGGGLARALEPGAPVGGEVVVFAVYYPGIKDAVGQYAD